MAGYKVKMELELIDGEWEVDSEIGISATDMTLKNPMRYIKEQVRVMNELFDELGEDEAKIKFKEFVKEMKRERINKILENFKKEQEGLYEEVERAIKREELLK